MKKLVHVLFLLIIFCDSSFAAEIEFGPFPGWEKLIREADAIVILRVEDTTSPSVKEPYFKASCYILDSLKGDLQPNTQVPLELNGTITHSGTIVATHLAFLRKVKKLNGEEGYRSLGIEGSLIELPPHGTSRRLVDGSVEIKIKKVLAEAVDYFDHAHTTKISLLNKWLAHKNEILEIQRITPGSLADVSLLEDLSTNSKTATFNLTDMIITSEGITMPISNGKLHTQIEIDKISKRISFRLKSIEYVSAKGEFRTIKADGWILGSDGLRGLPFESKIPADTKAVAVFSRISEMEPQPVPERKLPEQQNKQFSQEANNKPDASMQDATPNTSTSSDLGNGEYEYLCHDFSNVFVLSVQSVEIQNVYRRYANGKEVPTSDVIVIQGEIKEQLRGEIKEKNITLMFSESKNVFYNEVGDEVMRYHPSGTETSGQELNAKIGNSYIFSLHRLFTWARRNIDDEYQFSRMDSLSEKELISELLKINCPKGQKVESTKLQSLSRHSS